MQKSAELCAATVLLDYLYTENGEESRAFANAFDSIADFSQENNLIAVADMIIIHNIIPVELLKTLPEKRPSFSPMTTMFGVSDTNTTPPSAESTATEI